MKNQKISLSLFVANLLASFYCLFASYRYNLLMHKLIAPYQNKGAKLPYELLKQEAIDKVKHSELLRASVNWFQYLNTAVLAIFLTTFVIALLCWLVTSIKEKKPLFPLSLLAVSLSIFASGLVTYLMPHFMELIGLLNPSNHLSDVFTFYLRPYYPWMAALVIVALVVYLLMRTPVSAEPMAGGVRSVLPALVVSNFISILLFIIFYFGKTYYERFQLKMALSSLGMSSDNVPPLPSNPVDAVWSFSFIYAALAILALSLVIAFVYFLIKRSRSFRMS